MILFLDSANHYTTAQIGSKYDVAATNATIVAAAGRLGASALFFNAALPARVVKTVTPSSFGTGGNLFTCGFACKVATLPGPNPLTLARLIMSAGLTISLQVTVTGQLQIVRSDNPGVAVCLSPANAVRVNVGTYLEWQWNSNNGSVGSAIIRVNQSVVAQQTFPTIANTYTQFGFGNTAAETGTFNVCDVYVLDGNGTLPVGGVTRADGTVTFLNDFLGNMSIQAMLPVADGLNLSTGNTKWTPVNAQAANFTQVNSRAPNDASGTVYNVAITSPTKDTYIYQHPNVGLVQPDGTPWGYFSNGTPWPLYGVQWVARLKAGTAGVNGARLVRKIVTGTFAGDTLSQGGNVAISQTQAFYLEALNGDPTNGNAAWNFANIALLADQTAPGNIEFGVVKV